MDTPNAQDLAAELVELQIHCVKCGGALEVQCAEWQTTHPLVAQRFACPYCRRANGIELPARVVWVTERPTSALRARH